MRRRSGGRHEAEGRLGLERFSAFLAVPVGAVPFCVLYFGRGERWWVALLVGLGVATVFYWSDP